MLLNMLKNENKNKKQKQNLYTISSKKKIFWNNILNSEIY